MCLGIDRTQYFEQIRIEKKWAMITVWSNFFGEIEWFQYYEHRMNIKCVVPRPSFSNLFDHKNNNNNTLRRSVVSLSTQAPRWPGGRHATPTELKMRSVIIAISVNFATFPANRNLRATAKSMRPRAKSFIRSISQINYNRQKFSISMTSEVRKCTKSAESDRFSGFLHLAIER